MPPLVTPLADRDMVIKGAKCALSLMGLCSDVMAEPLTRFDAPERARVRAILESLHLEVTHP